MTRKTSAAAIFLSFCVLAGCGGNEGILKSGKETPINTATPRNPLDKEIDTMRTAGFEFIYVLKRKDGGKLEVDDRGFIKLQTADANRRIATDDGVAVVIGSNTRIEPKNMAAFSQRFSVDNYSQTPETNGNSNGNK